MAHFAELNERNEVVRVLVVNDSANVDADGNENEEYGAALCSEIFGGRWKQTSYNGTFRKAYAGPGFVYRADLDGFQPPAPYASWSFNDGSWQWEAPVPMPADGDFYYWDEQETAWKKMDMEGTQ